MLTGFSSFLVQPAIMRPFAALRLGLLALAAPGLCASSGWGFADGTLSIHQKGAGIGGAEKHKYDFASHWKHWQYLLPYLLPIC